MRVRWFGQSTFLLSGERTVAIDPFEMPRELLAQRGLRFDYPPIGELEADLLLITHEHADHNAAHLVRGEPATIRATAGSFESPVGRVLGIASEHDDAAGTVRGANTIFRFTLDGIRCCHLGDLGQAALRPEQRRAIGEIDLLFTPAGGGPTVGGPAAAELVRSLTPRIVIPMHYRTDAIDFLDPPDDFLAALGWPTRRLAASEAEIEPLLGADGSQAVLLLAAPTA